MHIEVVAEVDDELVRAMARLLPQLSQASPPDRSRLSAIVSREGNHLLIARDQAGAVVGTLTLTVALLLTGRNGHIEDVVVDESARSGGVGSALVKRAIELATEEGCQAVELTSRPARVQANLLYQRLGFSQRETNVYRFSLNKAR